MNDGALKNNTIYWAEITDKDLKELFGKQLQLKFTGILFHNVNEPKQTYFLSQIKVFREINPSEIVGRISCLASQSKRANSTKGGNL